MSSTGVKNVKFNSGSMPGRLCTGRRFALRHCLRITLILASSLLVGSMSVLFAAESAQAAAPQNVGIYMWVNGVDSAVGTVNVGWGSKPSVQICLDETDQSENFHELNVNNGGGEWANMTQDSPSSQTTANPRGVAMQCATNTITSGWTWFGSGTDEVEGYFGGTTKYAGPIASGAVWVGMIGNGVTVGTGLGSQYTYNQSVNVSSSASCGGCATVPYTNVNGNAAGLTWNGSGFSGTITSAPGGPYTGTLTATEEGTDGSQGNTGSANWSFTVGQASQTISITSTAPNGVAYSGSNNQTYNVTASATSGLTPTLTIDGSSTSGCTISGTTVYYGGRVGSCIIDANQAGNGNYFAAPQVQQSFSVSIAPQTISFTSTAPNGKVYSGSNNQTYTPTVTASSGLTPTLTIDGSSTSGCTISGTTVYYGGGIGSCIIDANQAGNGNYFAAPQVQQSFSVSIAPQTISFTSTAPNGKVYSGSNNQTYTPTVTASSGLTPTLTIDNTASSICTISSGIVSYGGTAGTCTIDANQSGNTDYSAAAQVQQSFSISKVPQTISFTSTAPSGVTYTGSNNQTYTPTVTASSAPLRP